MSGFGVPGQGAQPGGFSLGANQPASGGFSLGTAPQTGGFTFGAQSAAPATGGLTFGSTGQAPGTAPLSFMGTQGTAPSVPSFGAPTQTPAAGGLTFGAPVAPTGLTFGAPAATTAAASLTFGGPAQATAPTFGAPTTASTGLSFGAPVATTAATGLSFGAPAATTTATGLSFGAPAPTTTATGLSFGAPAVTTAATGLSFGAPAQTTAATGLSFGAPATTTAAAVLSFGGAPQTTAATGLSFGAPVASTAATTTATRTVTFSTPATSSQSSGFSFGAGSSKPVLTPSKPPSLGHLGGEGGPTSVKLAKDNKVEPVIIQLTESFLEFVKDQKKHSSEVARASLKPISKTAEDIEVAKHNVAKLEKAVILNRNMITKLKLDTIRSLSDCEIAQRTSEMPAGFQSDNLAPLEYFAQLADRFQEQVISLRVEIESTEKHIVCALNPAALAPDDLTQTMGRLHECLVALAGRLQLTHSALASLRQRHLDLRKKKFNEFTDLFDKKHSRGKENCVVLPSPGPSPFSDTKNYHSLTALANQAKQLESLNQQGTVVGGGGVGGEEPAPSLQLKLPPGTKRGKR